MADDQPRPSENEHQDAERESSEAHRASLDSDDEIEVEDTSEREEGDAASEREDEVADASESASGDQSASVDETVDAAETSEMDEAVEADDLDAEDGAVADASSEDLDPEDSDSEDHAPAGESGAAGDGTDSDDSDPQRALPEDVRKYERFKKMDGAQYDRVNEFLRERTYITAREWAIARLCADFRTETGVEMTKIGENLPELVPFMTDTYTPQAVNQARSSFEGKVRQAGATFLYGAMSGFFTAEELDDMMYEVTEVAKFLLEVEGVDLSVDEELEAEDRISSVMREVQSASEQLRHDEMECPNCGHEMEEASSDD